MKFISSCQLQVKNQFQLLLFLKFRNIHTPGITKYRQLLLLFFLKLDSKAWKNSAQALQRESFTSL